MENAGQLTEIAEELPLRQAQSERDKIQANNRRYELPAASAKGRPMGGRRKSENGLGSGCERDRIHAAECERHRTNHDVDGEIRAGEVPFVCEVNHVSSP